MTAYARRHAAVPLLLDVAQMDVLAVLALVVRPAVLVLHS